MANGQNDEEQAEVPVRVEKKPLYNQVTIYPFQNHDYTPNKFLELSERIIITF